jgi:hypothetical protein
VVPDDGATGDGGAEQTIAQGAPFQVISVPGSVTSAHVVGSSPTDLWGTYQNVLYYFDGRVWGSVLLTPPVSLGNIGGQQNFASAGPGAVWIAHSYAVARVDTVGSVCDPAG